MGITWPGYCEHSGALSVNNWSNYRFIFFLLVLSNSVRAPSVLCPAADCPCSGLSDASELLPDNDEDARVDDEHGDERQQQEAEEVAVDHVAHVHHAGKDTVAGTTK